MSNFQFPLQYTFLFLFGFQGYFLGLLCLWEILGIVLEFVADANAADRTVRLDLGRANGHWITAINTTTIQATEDTFIKFTPGGTTRVITANEEHEVALPEKIILPPGSAIATTTTNIQTGDNYFPPVLVVRRWVQPQDEQIIV